MSLTFEQAAEQLGKLASGIEPHVARGLSFGLERHVREAAVVATVKRGVGRRLWGNRRKGAFAMFKREPIKMAGGKLTTQIIVKGLPALAEMGGMTRPHAIKPRLGSRLSFTLGGRRRVFPKVMHPGSRIAKAPVMADALDRGSAKVAAEIRKALDAYIASVHR